MKKKFAFIACLFFSFTLTAQGVKDSDGDGVNDSEDMCPSLKGTAALKGCPAEEKTAAADFITPSAFDAILSAVCNNTAHRQVKAKVENNKSLLTSFPQNGPAQNFPVYYRQTNPNNFTVTAGLSSRLSDSTAILENINRLLRSSSVCNGMYNEMKLTYTHASKHYSDVYADATGGVFFILEKIKKGNGYLIQFRISRTIYADAPKKTPEKTPAPPVNECADFEQILNECVKGYTGVKGTFIKEEIPAKYYNTTLPSLGLADKYVVESMNIDVSEEEIIRKKVIYYSAEKSFSGREEALAVYEKLKNRVKSCYSGRTNVTDGNNQKIYELFFAYKGKTIRVAVIFLNFFGSSVSVSVKVDE